jgi:D-alanine-D-alanine ligase-like ATP-grasp enzyme
MPSSKLERSEIGAKYAKALAASVAETMDEVRYKAMERYSAGWTDPIIIFGSSDITSVRVSRLYTQEELQQAIEQAVQSTLEELEYAKFRK